IHAAARKGAAATQAKEWTAEERAARGRVSRRLGLKPTGRWKGQEWTPDQVALLGTDHDEAIAKKLGRSRSAVTTQRTSRKIPAYSGWPGGGPGWTDEEIALLGTAADAAVAKQVGRTPGAVAQKRAVLGVPAFHGSSLGRPRRAKP